MNQLWFDGYEWYIAESAEEAQKLQIEFTGPIKYRDETNEFRLVDSEQDFIFRHSDEIYETKKVSEWIKDRPKGFFASTEV